MAVINGPSVSDDEDFDVVEGADPVSDLSSPVSQHGQPPHQYWPPEHYGRAFDNGQPTQPSQHAQQPPVAPGTRDSLNDSYLAASSWMSENDDEPEKGSSALKYTKSVMQRFWTGQDLLIAVMGMTGSGKTTFISKVTGRPDLKIGHSLTSCTRDIEVIETKIDGRVVRFVDTPGFSDTNLSDSEVLQLIADYLAAAYKNDMKLSGIIYLHPISDTRVTHHATKNLQMFQKLTGENNLKNVVLATSMWDKVSPEEGLAREQELKNKFWKVLLAFEAKALRYAGTAESARSIAQILMANKPFFVRLQKEMGKDNKALRDTAAGQQVMMELVKMKEEHKRELADMEATMRNTAAENKLVVEALKEHYQERLKDLEKMLNDERRLNEEAVKSLKERVNALENRGRCAVM
ncbi:P-loop containing nucleoside triphosphate hydrolase protein [Xylaria bambusicola]|uniref:P-loop containing nucleoside triphosphate hydrolase protein n=1 Tax=Xylaria bambusicola TaxID=326684 RepID=UPI0020078E16|nr:P-loop containing nucleoside triphosphate hydrolase protein [Xylaria bambusicola]KAI0503403.1 P-loop containing nucleoside triphosphate hydrolase protein [Xylaria bambusicola]